MADDKSQKASPEIQETIPSGPTLPLEQPREVQLPSTESDKQADESATNNSALKFAEELHQYVREYIRNADQKAAFFFAAVSATLAFLYKSNATTPWSKDLTTWTLRDVIGLLAMILLAISACTFLMVVFPRLKGGHRGLIFFGAIAEYNSSSEFIDAVLQRTPVDICRAKLKHVHVLSVICKKKYRVLNLAFWFGSIGSIGALIYLVLGGQ